MRLRLPRCLWRWLPLLLRLIGVLLERVLILTLLHLPQSLLLLLLPKHQQLLVLQLKLSFLAPLCALSFKITLLLKP